MKTPLSLWDAPSRIPHRIVSLPSASASFFRLEEMGLREGVVVSKTNKAGALVCDFEDIRIALGKNIAQEILVEPLTA